MTAGAAATMMLVRTITTTAVAAALLQVVPVKLKNVSFVKKNLTYTRTCSACHSVTYCGRECQRKGMEETQIDLFWMLNNKYNVYILYNFTSTINQEYCNYIK